MFSDITQKENVFRRIKKLNYNTSSGNAIFDLAKIEGGSQKRITETPKVEEKLNTIKMMMAIIKKIK